jgi:hypothetical protein
VLASALARPRFHRDIARLSPVASQLVLAAYVQAH